MAVARGVVAMLHEHWDALEGDWSIHHHRDLLADVFGPNPIGVRRLKVLIEALPHNSLTARSADWWSDEDEQAAVMVELLADIALATANGVAVQLPKGKRYNPKRPLTWPRRGMQEKKSPPAAKGRDAFRSVLLRR